MIDRHLNFRKQCDEVIAKGLKRAYFLSSLSNTQWGIPPNRFKTLITTIVHAATDYAVPAWLQLPIPIFYAEKLRTVNNIMARKALGTFKSTPLVFLRHGLNLPTPDIHLSGKILNFLARASTKPLTHPIRALFIRGKTTSPKCHKAPFNFAPFLEQAQLNPTCEMPSAPNFSTVIQQDKDIAIKGAKQLTPTPGHVVIFANGSRIPNKNTAAAAWCGN